ncbi:MAG: hypothetical protein LBE23_05925 [Vagococcus sp.]|jgi:hypothetical protein|nr:hypothetical protein [Vagococcus sp.]
MNKNEVKIKDKLSLSEKAAFINIVVNNCFRENEETGELDYTPYLRELFTINAFATYVLDGVEFTEDDNVYELILGDTELERLYYDWTNKSNDYLQISTNASDMIEFKKQQVLSKNNTVSNYVTELLQKQIEIADLQKVVLEQQKELNSAISPEDQKAFTEKFMGLSNEDFITELVKQAHKDNQVKPQDHKKPQAKKKKNNITALPLPEGK